MVTGKAVSNILLTVFILFTNPFMRGFLLKKYWKSKP